MRNVILGIVIGLLLAISGYYLQQEIREYISSHATISPIGKVFEKRLEKYTINALSGRAFEGSQIVLDEATATESSYTVYPFHFQSDGKKVTGMAHIPNTATSENKKPVIVQFRGYVDRETYFPGQGTQRSAEVFAQNGFISLAPDFIGYGGSDKQSEDTDVFEDRFETYTTALNLLASVKTLPIADAGRVGIWGHSNGGQIAITVAEILHRSIPVTLWAPVTKPFPYSILYYTDEAEDHGKELRKRLAAFERDYNAELYSLTNYLDRVVGPIQLHQGSVDDAVPIAWSDDFAEMLKEKGIDIEYFTYTGADHNLAGSWNTVVSRDIEFFRKYLK
jgi:uncharacterized protein